MEREISVEVICKQCENEMTGKFLLNTRTDKANHQRVNIPLGELTISDNEIGLICDDVLVDNEINLHYLCKNCGIENHIIIQLTDDMR